MRKQDGYTLIELLMAMALFSSMLVIIISGFLTVVKLQESGNVTRTTQQDSRYGVEDIVRTVRAAESIGYPLAADGTQSILCVRNISGNVNEYYVDSSERMMKLVMADCDLTPSGGTPISSTNVAVKTFQSTFVVGNPPSVSISLSIGSTDASQFTGSGPSIACDPTKSGAQYCSLTTITTAATPRGGE